MHHSIFPIIFRISVGVILAFRFYCIISVACVYRFFFKYYLFYYVLFIFSREQDPLDHLFNFIYLQAPSGLDIVGLNRTDLDMTSRPSQ